MSLSAKEKVFIQAEDSVRIEAKKSITLDSREGVTIEKLLTVSGTSIFNRCLVQMPSKDARQNSEPIENALLILSQLKPIKYAHGQDGYGQRRFGFATEGVHGQGEIMSSHGMSLSDLSSLIVESVKSLAVKMENLENSHRKLNGLSSWQVRCHRTKGCCWTMCCWTMARLRRRAHGHWTHQVGKQDRSDRWRRHRLRS